MEQQEVFQDLINYLRAALGMLDFEQEEQLRKDVIAICDYFENPIFRIAVFGPFNYGKSTLLNAVLGKRTLPIDLIPTTGAAIHVRYGDELRSRITLTDGTEISEDGTQVLKRYAILDDQRCMRNDVTSVEVYCPHPFLKTGVEFLDLPGTNDREAQDALVRDQLLTADLVVQVLDARKLMTLGERENLRDWLLDRGIETVVFVVNFLNLLEPEDQKEVHHRLRFVAESFRAELPPGISNLYRVDALPALRARLKGDTSAAHTTGLAGFESALQSIVAAQKEKLAIRFPRVLAVANKVKQAGNAKAQAIAAEIEAEKQKQQAKIEIKQKAEKLIKQGFERSVSDFQGWLYLPKLLSRYQAEVAIALQQGIFNIWETEQFKPAVLEHQQAIGGWVNKGCEFFEKDHPGELLISFPDAPEVSLPEPPKTENKSSDSDIASVAIPTGLGWVLGGPVGAVVLGGASYILNKATKKSEESESSTTSAQNHQVSQAYADAAEDYLTRFSNEAFSTLRQYEEKTEKVISFQVTKEPLEPTITHHQLQLLNTLLENLNQELEFVSAKIGK
ncbi:MAG: dynamin family protein [Xenococcaceae cyanobacterium]